MQPLIQEHSCKFWKYVDHPRSVFCLSEQKISRTTILIHIPTLLFNIPVSYSISTCGNIPVAPVLTFQLIFQYFTFCTGTNLFRSSSQRSCFRWSFILMLGLKHLPTFRTSGFLFQNISITTRQFLFLCFILSEQEHDSFLDIRTLLIFPQHSSSITSLFLFHGMSSPLHAFPDPQTILTY